MNTALDVMMNTRMNLTRTNNVQEETSSESVNGKVDKEKKIFKKYDPPIRFKGRESINFFRSLHLKSVEIF